MPSADELPVLLAPRPGGLPGGASRQRDPRNGGAHRRGGRRGRVLDAQLLSPVAIRIRWIGRPWLQPGACVFRPDVAAGRQGGSRPSSPTRSRTSEAARRVWRACSFPRRCPSPAGRRRGHPSRWRPGWAPRKRAGSPAPRATRSRWSRACRASPAPGSARATSCSGERRRPRAGCSSTASRSRRFPPRAAFARWSRHRWSPASRWSRAPTASTHGRGLGGLVRVETADLPSGLHGGASLDPLDATAHLRGQSRRRLRIAGAWREGLLHRILDRHAVRRCWRCLPSAISSSRPAPSLDEDEEVQALLLASRDGLERGVPQRRPGRRAHRGDRSPLAAGGPALPEASWRRGSAEATAWVGSRRRPTAICASDRCPRDSGSRPGRSGCTPVLRERLGARGRSVAGPGRAGGALADCARRAPSRCRPGRAIPRCSASRPATT